MDEMKEVMMEPNDEELKEIEFENEGEVSEGENAIVDNLIKQYLKKIGQNLSKTILGIKVK